MFIWIGIYIGLIFFERVFKNFFVIFEDISEDVCLKIIVLDWKLYIILVFNGFVLKYDKYIYVYIRKIVGT